MVNKKNKMARLPNGPKPALLYTCYLLSGFSALVYEILWSKQLSLIYGTTLPALSVVTATYMAGLAIGNVLFGRRADKCDTPLKLYAQIEAGIALTAALVPFCLPLLSKLYVALFQSTLLPEPLVYLTRFAFSSLLLLPTTILVGGTLPVMCKISAASAVNVRFGRLYAINILGAVAGCLGTAFLLIPGLGLANSNWTAVACNAAIALVCLVAAGQARSSTAPKEGETRQPAPSLAARFLLACVALQGAFALAYEILWTRVFLQYLGNTTFAFATMLGAFLVGLACGSAIYTRWLKAVTNRVLLFFWLFLLSGISILATAPFYDVLFYLFDPIYTSAGDQWGLLSLLLFLAVAATIFIPTALSGAVLPAALGILAPEETSVGSGVGRLLFWNTFGAIAGSIAGGFLLIPHFGLLNSFRVVATVNVLAAFIYLARNHAQIGMKPLRQGLALVALVVPFWLMSWNQLLINSGTYVYSQLFEQSGGMAQYFASQRLLHLEEGSETTVALVEHVEEGTLSIKVNGKVDGSNGENDMQTQVLAGQLPALVHENPKDVLVIGLGTGITLAQLAQYPDLVIDCLEISPEVIATAKVFDPENISLLNNPKVNLVVEDGRNWLLTRPKQYDLIVSEPSNPWQSGNANLFTHEFYQLVKQRLAPGGIFCQWIPLYDLPPKYVNVALRTLLETFPHLRAFIVNQSEMIILSTQSPIPWDADRVNQHLENEQVAASLKLLGVEKAIDLAKKYYFCDQWPLKALANEAALNSDGHPILEFSRHAVRLDWDLINMQKLLQVRAAYQAFREQRTSSKPQ